MHLSMQCDGILRISEFNMRGDDGVPRVNSRVGYLVESFFCMRQATTYGEEANEVIRQHRDRIEAGGCHERLDISGSGEVFLLPAFLQKVVYGVSGDRELLLVHGGTSSSSSSASPPYHGKRAE